MKHLGGKCWPDGKRVTVYQVGRPILMPLAVWIEFGEALLEALWLQKKPAALTVYGGGPSGIVIVAQREPIKSLDECVMFPWPGPQS